MKVRSKERFTLKNKLNNSDLKRDLGLFSATALVVANMVGTGIFTTSGFIMQELQNPYALLWAWFIGGLFALCGALCYGELGSIFPQAGGEYVFLREGFGKAMGFLSGWISLIVGFSAPIAAAAMAFAVYFFQFFGPDLPGFSLNFAGLELLKLNFKTFTAAGVVLALSLVHYHSLLFGSRVQNALTTFKVLFILGFVCLGFWLGQGSALNFEKEFSIEIIWQESFAVSLIFVTFAYSGWNAAAYLGSEIIRPKRNIPLALFLGTALVMILYLLLNAVFIYALSPEAMSGVIEVGTKSALSLFGQQAGSYFSLLICLGLLSVLSAMIMSGPRIYYAMSRDKVFFNVFSKVNAKHKTPARSIFLQAGIAILLILTTSFDSLLLYIGFTLSLFAVLTVVGLFRIRARVNLEEIPYKSFAYPLTPILFIAGNLWIIYFSIKSRPLASLLGLGTILLGWLVYSCFYMRQRGE